MSLALAPCPSGQASTRFFKLCSQLLQPARRHQTTYRRTRSKLNIKPDASFLPSKTEQHDHIIFNPPPSMPNVYHTPAIFLPRSDKRRQMQKAIFASDLQLATTSPQSDSTELPPPVRTPYEKKYHVTPEQIEEIRVLRQEDPYKWSITQLAKKYECSEFFVTRICAGLARQKAHEQKMVTAVIKSRWGPKRRIAREDRQIRKENWYRDA